MRTERHNGPTPAGGDYSEIFYFSKDGKRVDCDAAYSCIIRECKSNGDLIAEIRAILKNKVLDQTIHNCSD